MKPYSVTIQIRSTEQYFLVVMFVMLYKVILTLTPINRLIYPDLHGQRKDGSISEGNVLLLTTGSYQSYVHDHSH